MGNSGTWPVAIVARGYVPVTCGTVTYRAGRETRVTAVVRATFCIEPDGIATVLSAEPVVATDRHHGADPRASIEEPSQLAPFLPMADVIVVGHAYAPPTGPVPELEARLLLRRLDRTLVDKSLRIQGDRMPDGSGRRPAPQPFHHMPLVWERGVRSMEENPVGVDITARGEPNILYPSSRARAAGFGPLSRSWPTRKGLLKKLEPKRVEGVFVDAPEGFDWTYFQCAPKDQRTPHLHGDEELTLIGMHPSMPVVTTRLPGLRAVARVTGLPQGPEAIEMRLDMLIVDTDAQTVSLVFRGSFVAPEGSLPTLEIHVGAELPGAGALSLDAPSAREASASLDHTQLMRRSALPSEAVLPFVSPQPGVRAGPPPAPLVQPPTQPAAAPATMPQNLRSRGEFTTVMPRPEELPKEPVMPFAVIPPNDSQRPTVDRDAPTPVPGRPIPPPPSSLEEISGLIQLEDESTSVEPTPFDPDALPPSYRTTVRADMPQHGVPDTTVRMARGPVAKAIEAALAASRGSALGSEEPPPSSAHPGSGSRDTVPTDSDAMRAAIANGPNTPRAPSRRDPGARARVRAMLEAGESLQGAELDGADLSGLDLEGRNLSRASLRGADLKGARLSRANLAEADLEGADLSGANLVNARLDEANLRDALLASATLDDALLAGADFAGARAKRASFARVRGPSVVFADADLRETRFLGADLPNADFAGACLDGAQMNSAVLVGATFARATAEGVILASANLSLATLRRAHLLGANLSGANLTRASFERADLRGADLSGASTLGIDIQKANLADALLDKAFASDLRNRG
jgi:uncharacterized protein YjbI with pentapeptide repeats